MRIVGLNSGGGGNLAFLWLTQQRGLTERFEVVGSIADRESKSAVWARKVGLPVSIVNYSSENEEELLTQLDVYKPDLVLTNIHKILGPKVLEKFTGRLINLHYSLLPLFPGTIGTKPVQRAIEAGCKWIGTTVHKVTAAVDGGEIISQSLVPAIKTMSFDQQMNLVFRSGCINLLNAISIIQGRSQMTDLFQAANIKVSPGALQPEFSISEDFWVDLESSLA